MTEKEAVRLQLRVEHWRRRGKPPADIETPGSGQESVWTFPRPPRIEHVTQIARVVFAGETIAMTSRALRVCETAGAPVYYIPRDDVHMQFLERTDLTSECEWKGIGVYWTVSVRGAHAENAAWSYPDPYPTYAELREHLAFYPERVDACYLGDERVRPQEGRVYGGWITDSLAGPIKGAPGTEDW